MSRELCIKCFAWLLTCLWMMAVLSFSSDTAEESLVKSGKVVEIVEPLVRAVAKPYAEGNIGHSLIETTVRKLAHMFNYAMLYLLNWNALRLTLRNRKKAFAVSWALTIVFAIIDEMYQTTVTGRGGQPMDVAIDGFGALVCFAALYLHFKWSKANGKAEY